MVDRNLIFFAIFQLYMECMRETVPASGPCLLQAAWSDATVLGSYYTIHTT